MKAKVALIALVLASPAAQTAPSTQPAAPRSGVVSPPDDNSTFDDVAESFEDLFAGSRDRNIREMVMFRIKQGRCEAARRLAMDEGKPELAAMVPKVCTPKP